MSNAKQCDRCGNFYSIDFTLTNGEEWQRYEIRKENYPYGDEKVDLCIDCRKKLCEWLKGGE